MGLGQYEEAMKCFQNAVEIDPQNSQYWVNEGECWEALGNLDAAMSCYNQALKVKADNSEAKTAKEKLIAAGTADNTNDPPVKQYATGNLLQVTGPVMTITVNEGEAFSTTMTVTSGQAPYSWFLKTDNGITSRTFLSTNETGDTLTVSGTAAMIADDTTTSRYAFIEVRAEDSSSLTRKGEGSFQLHVINIVETPSPTPTALATNTPSSTSDSVTVDYGQNIQKRIAIGTKLMCKYPYQNYKEPDYICFGTKNTSFVSNQNTGVIWDGHSFSIESREEVPENNNMIETFKITGTMSDDWCTILTITFMNTNTQTEHYYEESFTAVNLPVETETWKDTDLVFSIEGNVSQNLTEAHMKETYVYHGITQDVPREIYRTLDNCIWDNSWISVWFVKGGYND
jgi:hypothetical protein